MKTVYQSDLVDLKVVETESNGEVFYQVWKDGVVCKQSTSDDHCKVYAFDLLDEMVKAKLQSLKTDVYYSEQACLLDHEDEQLNLIASINYNEAHKALDEFKGRMK